MYKIKPLAAALGAAGLAAVLSGAPAVAQQSSEPVQKLEKVEVTGSAIKRVQAEGPAPVEVVTRQDIERTGATNVTELMKSIPTLDVFDFGELQSNSASGAGTSYVRIRGMSENNVLVLLNGRRLPVNALNDTQGSGAAVDVNMIPISAIERVEVLKDGGSAIYGADAVAGVINFITKKNYQGLEVKAGFGTSYKGDGTEKQIGASAGWGDFEKDGYNVLASFDVFKRDPIYRKDRDISRSVDFRRFGGPDRRSLSAPEGNLIDPNTFALTGRSVKPCPPERYNGGCRYDFNADVLTAYNGADRFGGLLLGRMKVSEDLRASVQGFFGNAKDEFEFHPVPDIFVLPNGDRYYGRFMQGGLRKSKRTSNFFQVTAGLEGSFASFDWEVVAGHGRSRIENRDSNYFHRERWNRATSTGRIDATRTDNDPALVDSLRVSPTRDGTSKLNFLDFKLTGEAAQLPGGPLGFAVGASTWREALDDRPDDLLQTGMVVGAIAQSGVNAARTAKAAYVELSIPPIKNLEIQAAVRYDSYPKDSRASPKLAARYQVTKDVMFRGSYAESFRVPTLKQLYGAQEQGATTVSGAAECRALNLPVDCEIPAYLVSGSSSNLKPEKGKTFNLGVVVDVGPFSTALDWWKIRKSDNIAAPTQTQAMQQGQFGRDPEGRLLVYTILRNMAEAESQGIDWDTKLRFKQTPIGTVTLRNSTTYYQHVRRHNGGAEEWEEYNGTYATPRWRNVFSATTEYGAWAATYALRSVAGFADTDVGATQSHPTAAVRRVPSHHESDLQLSYTGLKNLKVDVGVKNLFNRMPPFSLQNAASTSYTQMGFAEVYNNRGRFYAASASYKFK